MDISLNFSQSSCGAAHGEWGVGGGEGDVAEKRRVLFPFDERQGLVRADIGDVALGLDHLAVVLKRCVKIFAPVSRGVAEVFVKSPAARVVGVL